MSKSNVVTVRLDDDTFNKLKEIQDKMQDNVGLNVSYGALIGSMIHLTNNYINTIDSKDVSMKIFNPDNK